MVWHRKWTLATWLFIVNQYLLIVVTIWSAAPYTSAVSAFQLLSADDYAWLTLLVEVNKKNCPRQFLLLDLGVVGFSCAPGKIMGGILIVLQYIVFAGGYVSVAVRVNITLAEHYCSIFSTSCVCVVGSQYSHDIVCPSLEFGPCGDRYSKTSAIFY